MASREDYKVLPFEGAQGPVPGHEIRRHTPDYLKAPVEYVVFLTFDQKAGMPIQILVHWTCWTEWTKKRWPKSGEIVAVICEDDRRIGASARVVGGHTDRSYDEAPILCRDDFAVGELGGPDIFLEVVGVHDWIYSARDAEATARLLVDPWKRDNEAARARLESVGMKF